MSKNTLAAAALAGLLGLSMTATVASKAQAGDHDAHSDHDSMEKSSSSHADEKHGCAGQNSCKGQGGCATDDNKH
jgi:hypothetical protein